MHVACVALLSLQFGCSSIPKQATSKPGTSVVPSGGKYYLDDGPGPNPPANLDSIPDAVPRVEKFHSGANKPYTVLGRSYVPMVNSEPFRQTGIATWYGRKYHGNMTASGERYDMYAMTAAHPTLPLPSYVRVTNPANKKSVVVRVNDRGPFHENRIIDLSYAAAHRLDLLRSGSGIVNIERVFASENSFASAPPSTPTISVSPITTPITTPIATEGNAVFLQLGAFAMRENAESFRQRMIRELDWNHEPPLMVFKDGLWRVRLGPYATAAEAEAIQARVKASHDFLPLISKP